MIDKMYVMLKEFQHKKVNINKFIDDVLNEYKKKNGKTAFNNNADAIKTWLNELNRDGKITTKYSGRDTAKEKDRHYQILQRKIEKIWSSRDPKEYRGYFMENTIGNLGKENISTRNNKIFDIQWAVLTNEDTMSKMFNPGNFEVPKKTARIIRALQAGVSRSYEELSKMSINELDSIIESSTGNIIYSTTQVAFHKQNMTAGKLIGIFANNNTSHAFLSMQHIHFKFRKGESFTIDGHTISNTENNKLDRQTAFDGSLISKNLASFLAASVDAVKDPVLNFMNLNTFTSGPSMVLARLGFDSDTIGLIMSQPVIQRITREYFRRNNDGYVSVEDIIDEELYNFPKFKNLDKIPNLDFSKDELAKGIADNNPMDDFQGSVLLLFSKLSSMAVDLNTLTFLTKFNSVSNATGPTIADTLVMQERYKRFRDRMAEENPTFDSNAVNVIDNSAILKAFYETTVGEGGASDLIFRPYFPEYSQGFSDVLALMRDTTKSTLDSYTINKLMNDYILYKLTAGDNPVINSNPEQRKRFIVNFVNEFKNRAKGIVDNDLINAITVEAANYKCKVPTLRTNTGRFGIDMQERIRNAWAKLMENPETFDLGRDLFIYNIYRSGFNFSPKTFLHLASVDTKLSMADYIDAIADPDYNDRNVSIADFLLMFRRNHSGDSKLVPSLSFDSIKNTKTSIKADKVNGRSKLVISYKKDKAGLNSIIARKKETEVVFAPVISFNGKLYYTDSYKQPSYQGSIIYIETSELGNTNNFLEYNANEDASEMMSVLKKSNSTESSIKDSEDRNDPSEQGSEANYDPHSAEITVKDLDLFFSPKGVAPSMRSRIMEIAKTEGDDLAVMKLIELAGDYIENNKKSKLTEELEEFRKKFCK